MSPLTENHAARQQIPLPLVALFIACAGLFAAGVLSIGHWLKLPVPCGESRGCLTVATHPASELFGVPIAFFGVVAYLVLIVLLTRAATALWARRATVAIASVGALGSLALSFYAIRVIKATCVWCLASAAAMSLLCLLSVVLLRSRREWRPVSGNTSLSLVFLVTAALALQTRAMQHAALMPPIPAEKIAAVPASELTDAGNALGPRDAPVTIVMFSDLWCPTCRQIQPSLVAFQKANPRGVRLIYRHLPLMGIAGHEFSGTAAALSEMAAERGLFWVFVERLHRHHAQLDANGYLQLMNTLGFKAAMVKARSDNPRDAAIRRVQRDMRLAEKLGIHATPSFIALVEGSPPVSASERGLAALLNSPAVQAKLANTRLS